jgi:hypothetical protein
VQAVTQHPAFLIAAGTFVVGLAIGAIIGWHVASAKFLKMLDLIEKRSKALERIAEERPQVDDPGLYRGKTLLAAPRPRRGPKDGIYETHVTAEEMKGERVIIKPRDGR